MCVKRGEHQFRLNSGTYPVPDTLNVLSKIRDSLLLPNERSFSLRIGIHFRSEYASEEIIPSLPKKIPS